MNPLHNDSALPRPLTGLRPGSRARVATLEALPADQRERLQAYGLVPGQWVRVVQHAPVTVVQVEQTELALEAQIARGVQVE
jgi:Fe2+ transport system protein FeoA